MTPTEQATQNARVSRSIELQRMPKSRLAALYIETARKRGISTKAPKASKQELANELIRMESGQ